MPADEVFYKDRLFEAAQKLFYEQGYNSTTFSQIAGSVGVHKTLITYHFKNKLNLAHRVLVDYVMRYSRLIDELLLKKFGKIDLLYASALRTFVLFNALDQSREFQKFYLEYYDSAPSPRYGNPQPSVINALKKEFDLPLSDKKQRFIASIDQASREILITSYFSGITDLSLSEAIEFKVKLFYELFKLPADYIDEVYQTSRELYEELRFVYAPYFQISSEYER